MSAFDEAYREIDLRTGGQVSRNKARKVWYEAIADTQSMYDPANDLPEEHVSRQIACALDKLGVPDPEAEGD